MFLVFGPLLCNLLYDAFLHTSLPSGLSVVRYTDEIYAFLLFLMSSTSQITGRCFHLYYYIVSAINYLYYIG